MPSHGRPRDDPPPLPVRGSVAPPAAPPDRVAVAAGGAVVGVATLAVIDAAAVAVAVSGVVVGVAEPGVRVGAGVFVAVGVDVSAAVVFVATGVFVAAGACTMTVPDMPPPPGPPWIRQ